MKVNIMTQLNKVQTAVVRIVKATNDFNSTDEKTLKAKTDYFNSTQSLDDLKIVGKEVDQLFANANNGIGKRQFNELLKTNPEMKKRRIKKQDLEKNNLNRISQRLSECQMYYCYNKEIDIARVEMQAGDKPKTCTSLQLVERHMRAENIFPYDTAPKLKDVKWIVAQIQKMSDANEVSLPEIMLTLNTLPEVISWVNRKNIVKQMGKTTITPAKTKKQKDVSLNA
tara:strand:- start:177 stop:854 length:678 start_codon:yes stop_codon:yes gene_type:complete